MTKPFRPDLPCTTRDGKPVRILCTDAKGDYPICGLVLLPGGTEVVASWAPDGRIDTASIEFDQDLVNVPTKRKGWILVKPYGGDTKVIAVTSHVYASQPAAVDDNSASWQILEIEFDE